MTQASPTPAEQGRAKLAEWKADHVAEFEGSMWCEGCGERCPCPTARLVAAVEEMDRILGVCPVCVGYQGDAIARLAEPTS